jgi:hypothetical protein
MINTEATAPETALAFPRSDRRSCRAS